MKSLTDQLAQYAAYHRESRNVVTHMVGIPLIVVAVATLLSRPALGIGSLVLSPAVLAGLIAAIFYLRRDARFGIAMALLLALSILGRAGVAAQSTALWLTSGLACSRLAGLSQFVATTLRAASRRLWMI